ncbi:MAG: hypothetical protein MUO54_09335 [Anaerolineales bacterium]|nr:hypothetical protein [Anaerolineales bacterium]
MNESQKIALRLVLLVLIGSLISFVPVANSVTENTLNLQLAFTEGNFRKQAEIMVSLAEENPWWKSLWESSGDAAFKAGDFQLAKYAYQIADQKQTLSDQGQMTLAGVYLKLEELDSAEAVWQELNNNPKAQIELAAFYEGEGNYAAAIETWQAYLSLSENAESDDLLYHFGLLTAAHEPVGALVYLDQISDTFPDAEVISTAIRESKSEEPAYQYVTTGQALASINQWRLASYAFEQAANLRPDYLESWAYWGEALQHLEDPSEDPLELLEKALALDDLSPLVNMFLGLYWQRDGSHNKALEYFNKAEQAWSDHPEVYVEQGKSLAALGELETAVERYQQAIELSPLEGIYYSQLAHFCISYSYKVRELGLPAARVAVQLDDQNPEILDVMGQVMLNLDDEMNAVKFFHRSLEVDSSYAPAYFHLGIIYSSRDNRDLTVYYLQQVLLYSDNLSLIDRAERLISNYLP